MDWDLLFKGIIAVSGLLTVFGFVYGKSYFETTWAKIAEIEKARKLAYESEIGKIEATKKSIEELTRKVESVKAEFVREIEQLKSNLQFENSVRSTIYNERKQSIIGLYESLHLWFETVDNYLIDCIEFNDGDTFPAIEVCKKYYFNTIIARAKAELYLVNEEYFELLDALTGHIDQLVDIQEDLFSKFEELYFILNQKLKDKPIITPNGKRNLVEDDELHRRSLEEYNLCRDKTKDIRGEIYTALIDFRDISFKIILDTNIKSNEEEDL